MAKLSAGFHTPRPSSLGSSTPAARSSLGSPPPPSFSSAAKLPVATSIPRNLPSKVVPKCLDYNDDFTLPTTASTLPPDAVPEEDDLAPLPDPEVSARASTIIVISAASDDVATDSCVTEVNLVLSELCAASGLSPCSKRLLTALAEAATAELTPTATARRVAFWGKVRVAVLAATVATVAAVNVALAVYLYARRMNDGYHVLPPPDPLPCPSTKP